MQHAFGRTFLMSIALTVDPPPSSGFGHGSEGRVGPVAPNRATAGCQTRSIGLHGNRRAASSRLIVDLDSTSAMEA